MRRTLAYLFLTALSLLGAAAVSVRAQERKDSLVTLVSAKSAQLIERGGESFRKVTGPARFLHNNTYLLCDSALWNVTTNIIDKDKNTLRTRYLDYNTKDSVAIFQNGASMRDKDGQVIESLYGSYDSKARLFVFNDQVNMYMDTTFIKTSRLEYRSDINTAYFGYGTDMWQDDNMLSANDGWYDRDKELFFFRRNVHLLTKDQEAWSDTLYYHRKLNDVEMRGAVELMDTTRNVFGLAGRVEYMDSLSRVKMTVTPAVMSIDEDQKTSRRDTVWFGADTIVYRGIKRHLVDSLWKVDAEKRLADLSGDPVTEYRRKAAEEAAKAAEEAAKKNPNAQAGRDRGPGGGLNRNAATTPAGGPPSKPGEEKKPDIPATPPVDTTGAQPSLPVDSLAAPPPPPVDTTQLSFVWATSRVKMFRSDMQMSCDSLVYNDLDSLVRLYRDPLVFSDGNRQYAADSIYLVIKDRKADRARLMSNAFITTQEDTLCYDQIKGAEMMAYFDTTRTLRRFDALGGATALFFLTENDALATVNKVESKMLYALFDQGNLDKIYYFDEAKNDAYPVVQLPKDERYMKGFRWEPQRQPKGGSDITPLKPRKSQRTSYLARPHAQFKETEVYFPGHIKKIYQEIAYRDSMAVVRARQAKEKPADAPTPKDTTAAPIDTTAAPIDSIAMPPALSPADEALRNALDSLAKAPARDSLGMVLQRDSLGVVPALDSLGVIPALDSLGAAPVRDSLVTPPALEEKEEKDAPPIETVPDPQAEKKAAEQAAKEAEKARKAEEKAARDAEKARIAAEKQAQKEARWAEEDRKYEERQEAKRQKALEKERKKKLRILKNLERKAQKERRIFERYLEQERARAEKQAAREAEKAAREAEKAARKAEKAAQEAEKQDPEADRQDPEVSS